MSRPIVDGATLRECCLWPVKRSEGAGRAVSLKIRQEALLGGGGEPPGIPGVFWAVKSSQTEGEQDCRWSSGQVRVS